MRSSYKAFCQGAHQASPAVAFLLVIRDREPELRDCAIIAL